MKALTEEQAAKRKKTIKNVIIYAALTLFVFLVYYFALPPLNPQSPAFWIFLFFIAVVYLAPSAVSFIKSDETVRSKKNAAGIYVGKRRIADGIKIRKRLLFALIPAGVLVIGAIIGSPLFFARRYAAIVTVDERDFGADMAPTTGVSNIALMDTESARMLGQRTLGELARVVSQYTISEDYTQINYKNTPQKVANLEYDGFFKWIGNRKNGVPGYVMVDPVNNTSAFVELKKTMKYVNSAYFGEDLKRKLRFSYPTKIFGEPRFEIDDEGNPVYVVPCLKPRVFLFGATDVAEVIVFDPCTARGTLYKTGEVPSWVDIVFDGDLACEKYNWYGEYSGGFFNSIIGNKGCKRTTDDFGYVIADDDVWYYTGVTSVNDDGSNIGFILSNARTGEYKFYPVHGAEEHSAMGAAQGEVQEKGYVASFPALINVRGQATYVMVLKDANNIVKLYALVNVEQFGIVATGATQQDAIREYVRLLGEKGVISDSTVFDEATFVVEEIITAQLNGNTVYYIKPEGADCYYRLSLADDESVIFIRKGMNVTVEYERTEEKNIYRATGWKKA